MDIKTEFESGMERDEDQRHRPYIDMKTQPGPQRPVLGRVGTLPHAVIHEQEDGQEAENPIDESHQGRTVWGDAPAVEDVRYHQDERRGERQLTPEIASIGQEIFVHACSPNASL